MCRGSRSPRAAGPHVANEGSLTRLVLLIPRHRLCERPTLMPKKCIPVLLLAASLFAPLAGASTAPAPKTGGQSVHDSRAARKMTGDLLARARSAHRARGASARVIINLNAGTSAVRARRVLEGAGARVV